MLPKNQKEACAIFLFRNAVSRYVFVKPLNLYPFRSATIGDACEQAPINPLNF